jgi:site-specific DNA-cytosine methylase
MRLPMPTQATHADEAIVSMRKHGQATDTAEPAPTVNASGFHHGLLVYNGNPGFVRAVQDAAGTITSRDKQSLLVPYNRTATPVGTQGPAPVITASDRNALLEVTDDAIDEMLFRMLKWPELQRGQAMHVLPNGEPYQLTARVPARGGKFKELSDEQRVRMIGNAVSSPVAAMLGHAIAQSLAAAA